MAENEIITSLLAQAPLAGVLAWMLMLLRKDKDRDFQQLREDRQADLARFQEMEDRSLDVISNWTEAVNDLTNAIKANGK
jgi:hypothetical protein